MKNKLNDRVRKVGIYDPFKKGSWVQSNGFSEIEWRDENGLALSEVPSAGKKYSIYFYCDCSVSINKDYLFYWLPPDSSVNGIISSSDQSEMAQIKFVYGKIVDIDSEKQTIEFVPNSFNSPADLLQNAQIELTESEIYVGGIRHETSFDRFKFVEFNMESYMQVQYLFLDSNLIMMDESIGDENQFWIGNGVVPEPFFEKIYHGKNLDC